MIDVQLMLGIFGVYIIVGFIVSTVGTLFSKQYIDKGDFMFLVVTWPFLLVFALTVGLLEWYVDALDVLKNKIREGKKDV